MTSTLERPGPAPLPHDGAPAGRGGLAPLPLVLAAVVAVLRLPSLGAAPGADEAGFLFVARHWGPGTSLYGDFWVDRPPLLITLFRLADDLGGLVALRVIGVVAAVLVVLGAARAARQVVGLRAGDDEAHRGAVAAAGAAVVAAALCVSPVMGSIEVNGELLAAPFVVGSVSALLSALAAPARSRRSLVTAALAGAALAAAVLVKQNLVDAGVFAGVLLLVGVVRRELTVARALGLAAALLAGVVACGAVVAGWTVLHGTSLGGVYEAMYPFRVAAGRLLAASHSVNPTLRRGHLLVLVLVSGVPLVVLAALGATVVRRLRDSAVWALLAMVAYAVVSIGLGGSYWSHYLVELIVPVSVLAGLALAARAPGARLAAGLVGLSALVAAVFAMPAGASPGSDLGHAIRDVAHPGDTIVTVYGQAEVTETSGLSSPYPYLWSLPMRVRDPRAELLARTLSGPRAPTWFIAFTGLHREASGPSPTQRAVAAHYHRVADLHGHVVYLHDGVRRAAPAYAR